MGKTIKQIIDRAYYKAGIRQEGLDLTASEYTEAIAEYNNMIKEDAIDGLNYQASEVSDQTDDTHLPSWANGYIESGMALRACSEFNKPVPAMLPDIHEKSLRVMEKMTVELVTPYYSSILPTGSGESNFYSRSKYFGRQGDDDLVSQNGSKIQNEKGEVLENSTQVNTLNGDRNV